ncbi:aryl-alcohol oxidase [Mycena amicta]|nr:aryl-alcohol oxidase [Mycena amicta]
MVTKVGSTAQSLQGWMLSSHNALVPPALGAIYDSFAELKTRKFDFIVIRRCVLGGAGGNAVANRLSENPKFSVLLLEAGPSPAGLINYTAPFFSLFLRQPGPLDWNYTLTSIGLNDRVLNYPRGRILGGCTEINGLGYLRGSQEDFDRYAAVSGDSGWGWNALQHYFRKNEHWIPPTDGHNTTGQFNPAVHAELEERVAAVTQELPDEFPFNEDPNTGFPIGVSWAQSNIKHGLRSSSFTSYLGPEFLSRPNLHVVLNTQATRIIRNPGTDPVSFRIVEFAGGKDEPRHQIAASKEELATQDSSKPWASNLSLRFLMSGKNLAVHIAVSLVYNVNTTKTFDDIVRNATFRDELITQWQATDGTGPLGIPYISHVVTSRLASNASIFKTTPDPAAGPNSPHLHCTVQNGDINVTPSGHYLSLPATLLTPTSRGEIKIASSDPFASPIIDAGALNTDFDIFAAWDGYVLQPLSNLAIGASDEEIETYLRANAAPNGHMVGTAIMSPRGAANGVVDPDLSVKGINGLRIVDSSVLPYLPTGYTMTTTYMVAERGADLIKSAYGDI